MSDGSSSTVVPDLVLPAGCVGIACQSPGKTILVNLQNTTDGAISEAEAAVINSLATLMRVCALKSSDSGVQATYNNAAVALVGLMSS